MCSLADLEGLVIKSLYRPIGIKKFIFALYVCSDNIHSRLSQNINAVNFLQTIHIINSY
jgi:hypothetical protein